MLIIFCFFFRATSRRFPPPPPPPPQQSAQVRTLINNLKSETLHFCVKLRAAFCIANKSSPLSDGSERVRTCGHAASPSPPSHPQIRASPRQLTAAGRAGPPPPTAALKSLFAFQLGIFLPLHPPVLKPDFDLSLVQAQVVGDLNAPPPGEVSVKMEFFLQFQSLVAGVAGPGPFAIRFWKTQDTT